MSASEDQAWDILMGPGYAAKLREEEARIAAVQSNARYVHTDGGTDLVSHCRECGAALMPLAAVNVLAVHDRWHDKLREREQ